MGVLNLENFRESGIFTKQAHVHIPEGTFEEEHGRNGFFGRVSHIYHQQQPTKWTSIEGPLKPKALLPLNQLPFEKNEFHNLLSNLDVRISWGYFNKSFEHFFRNADADEVYFVQEGAGRIESIYGHLDLKKGDYIILPRGTTYKIYLDQIPLECLKIESFSEIEQPNRGLLGPNALYDQSVITVPKAQLGSEQNKDQYTIEIKRKNEITKVTYPFNPLDAVGWKGSLYPWKLSIYDFCPITSHKYHIPPSGHTTFVAQKFVICSFVARPLEDSKEGVLKVPFYHSNIDFDEVLFYHKGSFFSRDNIAPCALTFHPQGIHHGPHPKAFKNSQDKLFTDEFAVMIDTKNPLIESEKFLKFEDQNYWKSWQS
jgi:homogentisate 1,2-dioxygenase